MFFCGSGLLCLTRSTSPGSKGSSPKTSQRGSFESPPKSIQKNNDYHIYHYLITSSYCIYH